MTAIRITRAGPLTTIQDAGRPGLLRHGISASGPMDRAAFERAGGWLGGAAAAGVEFTGGLAFEVEEGPVGLAFDGGDFVLRVNGAQSGWPARIVAQTGDLVEIRPGASGNYGYVRFDREPDVPAVLGSRATNSIAGLGGRVLRETDVLTFGPPVRRGFAPHPKPAALEGGRIRIVWGPHADRFDVEMRQRFVTSAFRVSSAMDRMGVRLVDMGGVFKGQRILSLVSDAIVPGDIQVLGDGTPIVLMRDHQPTGGYPRIATVVSADFDRFAQMRPGTDLGFQPVTVAHAQELLR